MPILSRRSILPAGLLVLSASRASAQGAGPVRIRPSPSHHFA